MCLYCKVNYALYFAIPVRLLFPSHTDESVVQRNGIKRNYSFLFTIFILRPFQQYYSYVDGFLSHLFWKEQVLVFFPPRQTTKASPGDRTLARDITGLEVSDSNHSATKAV